jgi:hypothetical protein
MLDADQRAPRTGACSVKEEIKKLHPSFPAGKWTPKATEGVSRAECIVGCFCKVCLAPHVMTATLHAASRALYLLLAAGALQALVEQLAIAAQAQGAKCASNHAKNKGKTAMKKTVVTEECLKDGLAAVRDPGLVFLLRATSALPPLLQPLSGAATSGTGPVEEGDETESDSSDSKDGGGGEGSREREEPEHRADGTREKSCKTASEASLLAGRVCASEKPEALYYLAFDAGDICTTYDGEFWFGRDLAASGRNGKVIQDPLVSACHCCLKYSKEDHHGPLLEDVSTNGTFVNSEMVCKGSKALQWGDRVTIKGEKEVSSSYMSNCVCVCVCVSRVLACVYVLENAL